ncbi:hypothetical protein LTS18_002263 [Coniosporium uncinatum]|uniref:Uncharacterized protein n=1 Tax=Coniosporium uncinatum TaxID=93489 RepID=A0ACC3DDW0_9PEZI|nr:hypothetical protein LTS18_002263 [Coniosporium uncinatum]
MKYSIVVAATASEAAPLQYISCFTATSMGSRSCLARDIDAFRLKKGTQAASWVARNPEKVKAADARCKKKAVVERKHYCTTCERAFADSSKLKRHNNSAQHKNRVSGKPPTAKALQAREYSARLIANKTFHCATCDQSFDGAYHLNQHNMSQKHLSRTTCQLVA